MPQATHPQPDSGTAGFVTGSEILHQQAVNIPSIVIEQRFGDRDVLCDYEYDYEYEYEYDYEYYEYEYRLAPEYGYGVVDVGPVRVLKTESKTHHDRLSQTEPLTAFWERRQRQQTGFCKSRTRALPTMSCARRQGCRDGLHKGARPSRSWNTDIHATKFQVVP